MSYGKYGMKINNYQYAEPQNIWSALGQLAGTLWGMNYNRRGIERGTQEALGALRGAQSVGSVPDKLYDLGVQSGAIGATSGKPNTPAAASSASNTPIGVTGDQSLADKVSAQDKIATEKWGLYKTKYNSGTPNPDGDAKVVGNTASTIANNLAGFDFSTLPVTDAKVLAQPIEAQLRAAGRTDYQIQEIMKRISPQLAAKVQGNVNQATQTLYDQYKSLVQQGRYDESSIIMGKILELNPTVGKALANQYNRNQQDFKMQYDFDKQVEWYKKNDPTLSDREARNMVMYKNFRSPKEQEAWNLANGYTATGRRIGATGGGGGRGTGRSNNGGNSNFDVSGWGLTTAEQKELSTLTTYIDKYQKDAGHGGISDEQYNALLERRNALIGKLQGPPPQAVWSMMDNWLNSGMTYDEMRVAINNMQGLSDNQRAAMLSRVDDMEASEGRGHNGTGEEVPMVSSEKENPDSSGIFAGWGASEKTGAAKSAADSGAIWNGNLGDIISNWWSRKGWGGSDWK